MSPKPVALLALAAISVASPSFAGAERPAGPAPAAVSREYRIGLYDVLDIDVFQISDLHRQVQVDGAGRILLPLVGALQAQGQTPDQLSEDLRQRLEARFVNNAKVLVQVKQSQSEHVTVDGAVTSPGVYPLAGRITLMQAVAMARGPDGANANVHRVSLFHTVDSRWTRTEYDLSAIRNGKVEDPSVEGRDVIIVAGSRKQQVLHDLGVILPNILLLAAL